MVAPEGNDGPLALVPVTVSLLKSFMDIERLDPLAFKVPIIVKLCLNVRAIDAPGVLLASFGCYPVVNEEVSQFSFSGFALLACVHEKMLSWLALRLRSRHAFTLARWAS